MVNSLKHKIFILILLVPINSIINAQSPFRPVVTDIRADQISDNKIEISWKLPQQLTETYISSIRLYRETKPFTSINQLETITPIILPMGTISYIDTVYDFKEYYYAIITETKQGVMETELYFDEEQDTTSQESDSRIYKVILPGVNATVEGKRIFRKDDTQSPKTEVKTAKEKSSNQKIRSQPLPYIDVLGDNEIHSSTISATTTQKALSLLQSSAVRRTILEPYIFEEDIISPQGGDDYLLFIILSNKFIQQKYEDAITSLQDFLSQNRELSTTNRARFYLAESYYYDENYPEALSIFLSLEEDFPALVKKWSESSLDLYQLPDHSN